jgi:hypothetical protein
MAPRPCRIFVTLTKFKPSSHGTWIRPSDTLGLDLGHAMWHLGYFQT